MKIANKIFILSLIFFIILYTVCTIFFDKSFTAGVLSGYLLAVLNFFMLFRKVKGIFDGSSYGGVVFSSQLRLFATGAAIVYAYEYLHVSLFGVLVGLSVIPLCIPPVAIYHFRTEKDDII